MCRPVMDTWLNMDNTQQHAQDCDPNCSVPLLESWADLKKTQTYTVATMETEEQVPHIPSMVAAIIRNHRKQ